LRRRLNAIPLTLSVALVVGGCTAGLAPSPTPEPVGTYERMQPDFEVTGAVGISMASEPDAVGRDSGEPIADLLTQWGADVELAYASRNAQTQEEQIDAMIDAGVEVLLVQPVDEFGLSEVLSRAAGADIAVVAYDRLVWNTPDTDFYVGFDNFQVAVDVATATLAGLGLANVDGEPATVPPDPVAVEVFAGPANDAFFGFGFNGMVKKVLAFAQADGRVFFPAGDPTPDASATDIDNAGDIADRVSAVTPQLDSGEPLGIAAINNDIAAEVIDELKRDGYTPGDKWPIVVGAGGGADGLRAVRRGDQFATILLDERALHETAAAVAASLLSGAFPESLDVDGYGYNNDAELVPTYLVEPVIVTQANLSQTVFGSGYLTPGDLDG